MSPFFKKKPTPTPQPQPTLITPDDRIKIDKSIKDFHDKNPAEEEESDDIEAQNDEEEQPEVSNAVVSDGIHFCYKNVAGEVFDFHVGGLTVQHALNALDFCLDRALFLRNYKPKDKTDVNPLT